MAFCLLQNDVNSRALQLYKTPFILPILFPQYTWRGPIVNGQLTIYLTFDDGPVLGPTEFVLEVLRNQQVPAVFFSVAENITKHPELAKQIVQDGHRLSNHTYNHLKGWQTPNKLYLENIEKADHTILSIYNVDKKLFRPPYGRITNQQGKLVCKTHQIIMWDVLTHDYDSHLNAEKCLKHSIQASGDGSIVVFHDSYKAEKNLNYVLPRYIEAMQNLGFKFALL